MDYFAVNLPNLQVWDGSPEERNRIHCLSMPALGYAGLGDKARSDRYLLEAKQLNINHQGIQSFKTLNHVTTHKISQNLVNTPVGV